MPIPSPDRYAMTQFPAPEPTPLSLGDLDYALPSGSIAPEPVRPRDRSRLLVVEREKGVWTDSLFAALDTHLRPGDVLVLNNTRVLRARVFGTLARTGRPVEVLFAKPIEEDCWEALLRPGRRVRVEDTISFANGQQATVGEETDHGLRRVRLSGPGRTTIAELLETQGLLPLPPYLERPPTAADATDYQTVFGTRSGAIAAPTAGLHFSPEVFGSLRRRGVEVAELTLHVGVGTFAPVRTDNPADHLLKPERYEIPETTARRLDAARSEGRRIIAVGTTTTRTLEYVFAAHGRFVAGGGETDLYILPGYRFQAIDGLLTNFHLPRSTLLLLVAAFARRDLVMAAYRHAVADGYRFYSYGDCCLFL